MKKNKLCAMVSELTLIRFFSEMVFGFIKKFLRLRIYKRSKADRKTRDNGSAKPRL